jgi:hypothetical protein
MSQGPQPCSTCNRFTPAAAKGDDQPGHCSGWEKPVLPTNIERPCVLFNERGTWQARKTVRDISRDQFARDRKAAKV